MAKSFQLKTIWEWPPPTLGHTDRQCDPRSPGKQRYYHPRSWRQRPDLFLIKVKFFTTKETKESIQYFLPRKASLCSSENCTNLLFSHCMFLSPHNDLSPISSSNTICHYNQTFCSAIASSFLFFTNIRLLRTISSVQNGFPFYF